MPRKLCEARIEESEAMTFVRLCRAKVLALLKPVRKGKGFFDRLKKTARFSERSFLI
jgi:hypothetical protein